MTNQIIADASGSFNSDGSFGPNLATSLPPPADDAQAIEHATAWIYSKGPEAAGDDRFLHAVEVAAKVREFGVPDAAALGCCQAWTDFWCDPPLGPHQIDEAVHIAYSLPLAVPAELADTVEEPPPGVVQPGAQPAPAPLQGGPQAAVARPQPDAQAAPAPSPARTPDAQPQPQAKPVSGAKERMARRRAELKRLGLPAKYKGSLRALSVTHPPSVTPPVTPPVTPSVTPIATEVIDAH